MHKSIRVTCNDPDNRSVVLRVEGEVKAYAKVFPSRVRMSGQVDQVNVKTVSITPTDTYVFKILKTSFLSDTDMTCKVETKKEKDKTSYVLTLTNPSKKIGRFRNTLVVKTDHPKMPKIEIPISGFVSQPPKVKPNPGKS